MVFEFSLGCLQCSKHSSTCNTGSSLNVVVEGAILVAIFLKESEGILIAKVLKLNKSILSISSDHCSHELVNEVIIILSSDSLVSQSNVVNILKEFLSVGSHIKSDWQCLTRSNASDC